MRGFRGPNLSLHGTKGTGNIAAVVHAKERPNQGSFGYLGGSEPSGGRLIPSGTLFEPLANPLSVENALAEESVFR